MEVLVGEEWQAGAANQKEFDVLWEEKVYYLRTIICIDNTNIPIYSLLSIVPAIGSRWADFCDGDGDGDVWISAVVVSLLYLQ